MLTGSFDEIVRSLYPFVFQSIEKDGSYDEYVKTAKTIGIDKPINIEVFVDVIAKTLAKQSSLKEAAEFYYEEDKKTGEEGDYPWMSMPIQENDDVAIDMIIEFPPGEGAYLYSTCRAKTDQGDEILAKGEINEFFAEKVDEQSGTGI